MPAGHNRTARSTTAIATLALTAVVLLGACAGSETTGPGDAATASAPATDPFPVSVHHGQGDIRIPAEPHRVVALSSMDIDAALAVGVTPVGAAKDPFAANGISPWLAGRLDPAKTELLVTDPDISFELIAALKPDLILATGDYNIEAHYAKLAGIAPTLAPTSSAAGDSWQQRQQAVGQALGRSQRASQAVAETDQSVAAARAAYPRLAGKTFSASFAYSTTQIATLSASTDFAVRFLTGLGLVLAPGLADVGKTATDTQPGLLGPEQVNRLAADLVVIGFVSPQIRDAVEGNAVFSSVKASPGYATVDVELITELRNPSILGIPWLLEQLRPALQKVGG